MTNLMHSGKPKIWLESGIDPAAKGTICEYCGENEGTHVRSGYDVAPTDRGDERRYVEEWVCDECDPR